jgi:hypothetical protein
MVGGITAMGVLAATAVAGVGMEAYGLSQQSGVAGAQEQLAGQASYQSGVVFNEQQQYAKMLNDLIANPQSVTSLPGYDFNKSQGEQAVARQMAGSGFLGSGNEAIALEQYGQNYATSAYQTQASLLASLAGLNVNPTSGLGTASGALSGASAANSAGNSSLQQLLATLTFASGSGIFNQGGGMNTTPSNPTGATGGTINQGGYTFGLPQALG